MHFQFYQYFEVASLLVAFACWRGLRHFSIGLFIPLLVVDNTIELLGENYGYFGRSNSYFIYNFYFFFATPLLFLLFYRMLHLGRKASRVFYGLLVLTMLFIALNFFFLQKPQNFNSYSCILVMLLNIGLSSLVLFRLATKEKLQVPLFREPFFLINAGILLFSIVTLVVLGLQQYIAANKITLNNRSLYRALLPSANVILYSAYMYGFYLCQRQTKRLFF